MAETKGLRTLEELARLVYGKSENADGGAPTITPDVERCENPREVLEFAAIPRPSNCRFQVHGPLRSLASFQHPHALPRRRVFRRGDRL